MTFQQLREFCKVAECESVTKAAEELFITQPALSMTLKKIEAEIGKPLFDRQGRYLHLNDAGKAIYRYASHTLQEWDDLMEKLQTHTEEESKLIRFCYVRDYIPNYVIPMFVSSYPSVNIAINQVDEKIIGTSIVKSVYDIAISRLSWTGEEGEGITSVFFYKNRLLVSVPTSNPLARRESLRLKDIAGEKFIRLSRQGEFTAEVNNLAEKEGITLQTVKRVNYEVIKQLHHNTDFLYFITSLQTEFDYNPMNRRLIPLEEPAFTRDIYISYLKQNENKCAPFFDWVHNRWGI
ncbi:MAG: LysR family transcriptional regulator [Lachnospiraceae bacterium]|nr:LysR family transcriptional regulator [Lachnospiraceae bacterium]